MLKFITITLKDCPEYNKVLNEKLYLQSKYLANLNKSQYELEIKPDIMDKIILFLNYNIENPLPKYERPLKSGNIEKLVGNWYAQFIGSDLEIVTEIILTAHYLGIQQLEDLGMIKLACAIKNSEPELMKNLSNAKNKN